MAFAALLLASGEIYGGESESQLGWVGAWAASQQLVEPRNALDVADLRDVTLRQVVHLSIGGSVIRLRLSNRFGSTILHVTAAHLARPVNGGSDRI